MFHDRTSNTKINMIQGRALRIAYKDNTSNFETLLEKDNSISVHQKYLQLLMIEIYKTKNQLNPPFMLENFEEKALPYQLRCSSTLNQWRRGRGGPGGAMAPLKKICRMISMLVGNFEIYIC